ncbi:MAG: signal peptidase I [Bacteroidales bacterium]|jgi:signal peptidase I
MVLEIIFTLIILFFPAVNYWIFEDAGFKGYKSLIPIYNYFAWIRLMKKPLWWLIFMLIPFLNIFMVLLMLVCTAILYKKYKLWEQGLAAIFPLIYMPYLGLSKKEKFHDRSELPKVKKSTAREWVDAIIFAVVAASLIRMFIFEAYTIPTSSMEKSLLVGDFLFVSKTAYGPRMPNTPIAFPFVHHTLPLTKNKKSYSEIVKFPYYRFFDCRDVKRNDAVVFNYPDGDTVALNAQNQSYYSLLRHYGRQRVENDKFTFGKIVARPVDKRENYVKRCIAIAGDTLQIINQQVYINGKLTENPKNVEFIHRVVTDGSPLNRRVLQKFDITEDVFSDSDGSLLMTLTNKSAESLRALPTVKSVEKVVDPPMFDNGDIFPFDRNLNWSVDNYGPIYIPQKGITVEINKQNLPLYSRIIKNYENNDLKVEGDNILINGKVATTYTFKYDYYWMMGDNRHNSADSRFWGFVPEDHVVGKASFVWLSLDKNKSLFQGKIRWKKMFRVVK